MAYFDDENNVFEYIKMAEGYDGKELINVLQTHLKTGSKVLELGMGPGKDLDILNHFYKATGSDNSQVFLDLYRKKNKSADLLLLDARTLETERKFDCIYSNKVLHHLKKRGLQDSPQKRSGILLSQGLISHSFWKGNKTALSIRQEKLSNSSTRELMKQYWQERIEEVQNHLKILADRNSASAEFRSPAGDPQ